MGFSNQRINDFVQNQLVVQTNPVRAYFYTRYVFAGELKSDRKGKLLFENQQNIFKTVTCFWVISGKYGLPGIIVSPDEGFRQRAILIIWIYSLHSTAWDQIKSSDNNRPYIFLQVVKKIPSMVEIVAARQKGAASKSNIDGIDIAQKDTPLMYVSIPQEKFF